VSLLVSRHISWQWPCRFQLCCLSIRSKSDREKWGYCICSKYIDFLYAYVCMESLWPWLYINLWNIINLQFNTFIKVIINFIICCTLWLSYPTRNCIFRGKSQIFVALVWHLGWWLACHKAFIYIEQHRKMCLYCIYWHTVWLVHRVTPNFHLQICTWQTRQSAGQSQNTVVLTPMLNWTATSLRCLFTLDTLLQLMCGLEFILMTM
jgi:hypothetical protein